MPKPKRTTMTTEEWIAQHLAKAPTAGQLREIRRRRQRELAARGHVPPTPTAP